MARKANPAPALSPELTSAWQYTLDIASGIRDLAPWEYINPDAILGVRDPVSGEIDWCMTIALADGFSGVAIYQGDTGYASLQRLLQGEVDEFDTPIAQHCVTLMFHSAATVRPETKQLMKQLERKFRGSGAWPELLTHEPGFMPELPRDVAQLTRIANALCGLASMVPWASADEGGGACNEANHAWATASPFDELARFLTPLPKVPVLVIETPPFDQVAVARLQKRKTAHQGQWYVDWFCGLSGVFDPASGERGYYVVHLLCIEISTGLMLAMDISTVAEATGQLQAIILREAEKHAVPEAVFVRREALQTALQPLAKELGITLQLKPELREATHELRDQLTNFLSR